MKIKNLLISWDFILSTIITIITCHLLPYYLPIEFCKSFYGMGISVLSIIFSIFFAALAIIMASSDNDFIRFLEEEGDFTMLLTSFKITLAMLFISLIYSIVLFVITDYFCSPLTKQSLIQHKGFFLIFEFLFCYSLIATGLSVKDTIFFSNYRAKFLMQNKLKNKNAAKE